MILLCSSIDSCKFEREIEDVDMWTSFKANLKVVDELGMQNESFYLNTFDVLRTPNHGH